MAAYQVAKKYEEAFVASEAVRHYGVAFGYHAAWEALEVKAGLTDPMEPQPRMSHHAFAAVRRLIDSHAVEEKPAAQLFRDGVRMGVGMTGELEHMYGPKWRSVR